MSDHEQLHEALEREGDDLERAGDALADDVEAAKDARDRAAADAFIATPGEGERAAPGDPVGDLAEVGDHFGDNGPPPEASYPSKE
jgi:hypothetical protein